MEKYFNFSNPQIIEYIEAMAKWIEENSDYSYKEILEILSREKIENLFEPYPEIIFHNDPEKWAELFATSLGIIEEKELEFV